MSHDCELIGDREEERCVSEAPSGYKCTRPSGHDGDHVACGSDQNHHELDRWDSDE